MNFKRHTPARWRELDGVRDQVEQDLAQPARIGIELRQPLVGFDRNGQVRLRRLFGEKLGDFTRDGDNLDLFLVEIELAGLDLRRVEDVVDQLEQMPAGA